ncbi:acyl-CoA dehydrogenase family protein, partial [Rhodovulum sulfidophilum]|nr:acyl-CoA dehydrogenase family protein [Rhodovulum sulfidophilum]
MSVLTDEQRLVQEMARTFAREVLAPGAAARAKAKAIEPAVLAQMGELGFFGMTVPEEMGGVGADYVSYALALIEIAAGDGAVSTVMSVHNAPFNAILQRFSSPAQREKVLRPAAQGAFIGALD